MRSATDETGRLIETADLITTQEAEVLIKETPTTNAHHPGELEVEEETMLEAMAERSMRSVTGGNSNAGLIMCANFHKLSRLTHCTDASCLFSSCV